jgi:hypothetical protein
MAISKFFIDGRPDDYVLSIGIRRAPKPQKPEVSDQTIYLIIGQVNPALLRPNYRFISTIEELKKFIESAWNTDELLDPPEMDIFSHDILYRVNYHIEDDKATVSVASGSIIWGKSSSRPLALVEIDDKGNCKYYYYELEEAFKRYSRATPIEVSGGFDEFIRFLYDYENSTPYPYEIMKRSFPEQYRAFMNESLEDIINHR